jgi:hypothetical protein
MASDLPQRRFSDEGQLEDSPTIRPPKLTSFDGPYLNHVSDLGKLGAGEGNRTLTVSLGTVQQPA